jgi:hypothetical protein
MIGPCPFPDILLGHSKCGTSIQTYDFHYFCVYSEQEVILPSAAMEVECCGGTKVFCLQQTAARIEDCHGKQ